MSLFDTSVVTSQNKNSSSKAALNSALLNNQKTVGTATAGTLANSTFSGIESTSSQIPSAITSGASTGVSTATKSVSASASSITSSVRSSLSGVTSTVALAENSITSSVNKLFSSATSGIHDAFNSSTSSAFNDSSANNSGASDLKTNVPDPVKSSFSKQTPRSDLIKTTNGLTGMAPQSITGATKSSTDNTISGSTASLSSKWGTDLVASSVNGIKGTMSTIQKTTLVSGLYSGVGTAVGTASSIRNSVQSTVGGVVGGASSALNAGQSAYRDMIGGFATDLTGNSLGLDDGFNSTLSAVTDSDGTPIDGIPTTTDPTSLSSIFGLAKSLGCDISNIKYTSYGAQQSIFGVLLNASSSYNLTGILANLMNCNRFDSYGMDIAKNLFYQNANSSVGVSNTILNKIGGSQVATTPELTKAIVTNPNLTTADSGTVSSMLTTLGVSNEEPLQTGSTIGGDPVWDSSTLANSNIKSSLLTQPNASLAYMTNGESLDYSIV